MNERFIVRERTQQEKSQVVTPKLCKAIIHKTPECVIYLRCSGHCRQLLEVRRFGRRFRWIYGRCSCFQLWGETRTHSSVNTRRDSDIFPPKRAARFKNTALSAKTMTQVPFYIAKRDAHIKGQLLLRQILPCFLWGWGRNLSSLKIHSPTVA